MRFRQFHSFFLILLTSTSIVIIIATDAAICAPVMPKEMRGKCIEDANFMRRNHMELLSHQHGEAMYSRTHTKKYSLQGCINCHVVLDSNGVPVSIASEKHFCNTCHIYVAITLDCFMCHRSVPAYQE